MSTANIINMMKVPGYWVKNPTVPDSSSRAKGGIELGINEESELIPIETHSYLKAEEYNQEVNGLVTLKGWAAAFILRTDDSDMFETVYESFDIEAASTTASGKTLVKPVAKSGGRWLTDRAAKFLFVPDEPDRHLGVYFMNAVVFPEEGARIKKQLDIKWGFPLVFKAFPDENGNSVQWGRLEDMSV